jgi:hypothetical protein
VAGKMKRYALFAYDTYYPRGGWNDSKGVFDTLDHAKAIGDALDTHDYYHVVDLMTGTVVYKAERYYDDSVLDEHGLSSERWREQKN